MTILSALRNIQWMLFKVIVFICLSGHGFGQSVNAVSDSVLVVVKEMSAAWKEANDEASIKKVGEKSMRLAKKMTMLSIELQQYPVPNSEEKKRFVEKHEAFSKKTGKEMAETLTMLMSRGDLMPIFVKEMNKIKLELDKGKPIFDKYFSK